MVSSFSTTRLIDSSPYGEEDVCSRAFVHVSITIASTDYLIMTSTNNITMKWNREIETQHTHKEVGLTDTRVICVQIFRCHELRYQRTFTHRRIAQHKYSVRLRIKKKWIRMWFNCSSPSSIDTCTVHCPDWKCYFHDSMPNCMWPMCAVNYPDWLPLNVPCYKHIESLLFVEKGQISWVLSYLEFELATLLLERLRRDFNESPRFTTPLPVMEKWRKR